jgi:signal transduction histidine kinase
MTLYGGVERFGSGICLDPLGVETVSAQWAEWVASVPLIVYITIAMEEKAALEEEDWTILLAVIAAMILGLLLQLLQATSRDVGVAVLVGAMSCLCFILVLIFRSSVKAWKAIEDIGKKQHCENQLKTIRQSFVKKHLSRLICLNFPFFPAVYFGKLLGLLDRDQVAAGFAVFSIFVKTVFISSLSKSQMNIHDKLAAQLFAEKKANDTRRAFMRYVFHEVRVPLNTITMGLSLLKDDKDSRLSSSAREAIAMMTGATDFMSDTLNDVLSIHKIEEGAMELQKQPFKMRDLLARVLVTIKGQCDVKKIKVVIESPDNSANSLPYLIGDRFRLEHVVINFLSNAVKFSTPGSQVTIVVKSSIEFTTVPASTRAISSTTGRDYSFRHDGDIPDCTVPDTVVVAPSASSSAAAAAAAPAPPPAASSGDGGDARISAGTAGSESERRRATFAPGSHRGVDDNENPKRASSSPPSAAASSSLTIPPDNDDTVHYREVSIVVRDQGVGISKEGLAKLFVPFSQISPETLQQGQGSGLGLVLAKEIINLHGGVVLCDSVQGKGSSFGFRIPFEVIDRNSTFKIIEEGIQIVRSKFATPTGSRLNTPGASNTGSPLHSSLGTPYHSHRGSPLHSRPGSPAVGPHAAANAIPQRPTLALVVDGM